MSADFKRKIEFFFQNKARAVYLCSFRVTVKSDKTGTYERHYKGGKLIPAGSAEVFAFIDDHTRLSSHMNKSSWMMGGGRVDTLVEAGHGKEVGSHIRMNGKAFGITLFLDEVITHHESPHLKVWETVGTPRLLVIGNYRMKVEIESREGGSLLSVSIDYDWPKTSVWLGKLFSRMYAKWCVQQMIKDAHNHFQK